MATKTLSKKSVKAAKPAKKPAVKAKAPAAAKAKAPAAGARVEGGAVSAVCDLTKDPIEVVRAAAYVLTDRAYALLADAGKDKVRVTLEPKEAATPESLAALARTFDDELATQRVRQQISRNNVSIREYIVEQAILLAQQPAGAPPPPAAPAEPELSEDQRKEIERLIAEVEEEIRQQAPARAAQDPLKISASWEETHGKPKA